MSPIAQWTSIIIRGCWRSIPKSSVIPMPIFHQSTMITACTMEASKHRLSDVASQRSLEAVAFPAFIDTPNMFRETSWYECHASSSVLSGHKHYERPESDSRWSSRGRWNLTCVVSQVCTSLRTSGEAAYLERRGAHLRFDALCSLGDLAHSAGRDAV